jgi:hypothetical protein
MPAADLAPAYDNDAGLRRLRPAYDWSPCDGGMELFCRRILARHPAGSHSRGPKGFSMRIRAGYEISYDCPQPTPMMMALSVHPSRFPDLLTPDRMRLDPPIPANTYHDAFGHPDGFRYPTMLRRDRAPDPACRLSPTDLLLKFRRCNMSVRKQREVRVRTQSERRG